MLEKDVEVYLKKKVESIGGKCWKWVSPGRRGVPDRICLLPGGLIVFVEVKKPGKTPGDHQKLVHGILTDLGFPVFGSVDSYEKVNEIVAYMKLRGGSKGVQA